MGDADTALFYLQNIELDEKQRQRGIRTMMKSKDRQNLVKLYQTSYIVGFGQK